MKNLSNEINWFIQTYEYPNFKQIKYGEVINDLAAGIIYQKLQKKSVLMHLKI